MKVGNNSAKAAETSPTTAVGMETDRLLADVTELVAHAIRRVKRGAEIEPRLLDIDDAARYLAMSDKAVRDLITNGELPYIQKVPGGRPHIPVDRDAPLADFAAIADRYPVFLVEADGAEGGARR